MSVLFYGWGSHPQNGASSIRIEVVDVDMVPDLDVTASCSNIMAVLYNTLALLD
jgi:hypothetical protein